MTRYLGPAPVVLAVAAAGGLLVLSACGDVRPGPRAAATTAPVPGATVSPRTATPAPADPTSPTDPARPVVDRTVHIDELTESSGLAASLLHEGVLWSHNDSGDRARLFAIDDQGRDAATVDLRDVESRDAEAIQAVQVPGAGPVLVLADIGDNGAVRTGKDDGEALPQLIFLPEPARLGDAQVSPTLRISFTYPDGAHDAETLLADPRDQRLYVLTKSLFRARLFAVPEKVWPGVDGAVARKAAGGGEPVERTTTLTPVGDLSAPVATDGAIGPDGALVVRGYGQVFVFPPAEELGEAAVADPTASGELPTQKQGEALTFDPLHPASVLVGSEGLDQPVYRVPLP